MLPRSAVRILRTRHQPSLVKPCIGCDKICHWNRAFGPKKVLAPIVATPRLDTGHVSLNPHNYMLLCAKQYLDRQREPRDYLPLTKEGRGFYARTALYLSSIEAHDFTPYTQELFLWHRTFRPTDYEVKRNRALYEATGYWNSLIEQSIVAMSC